MKELDESPNEIFTDFLVLNLVSCINSTRLIQLELADEFIAKSLKLLATRIDSRDKQALSNIGKVLQNFKLAYSIKDAKGNIKLRTSPESHRLAKALYDDSVRSNIQSSIILEFLKEHGLDIKRQLSAFDFESAEIHTKLRMLLLDQEPSKDFVKEKYIKMLSLGRMKYILESPFLKHDRKADSFLERV